MRELVGVCRREMRVVWRPLYGHWRVYYLGKCVKIGYKYDDIKEYVKNE